MNYYESQLSRIKTDDEYPATVKLYNHQTETHFLDLNKESAQALSNFLKERFGVEPK